MSVSFDSTFAFDPAVQDSSMAARGLYATMVTWCDHQIYTREGQFDGTFDLRRVRSVGGNAKLVRELVANGLFREISDGVYTVATRRGLAVFGSFKNQKKPLTPEEAEALHSKKVAAGKAGGKASGEARRAKANARHHEAETKQTASTSAEQTASTTIPNQTITITSPDPSEPETNQSGPQTGPSPDTQTENGSRFAAAWNAYPRHSGSRREAADAFAAATVGHDGIPPVTADALVAAAVSYAESCDRPQYAPNMSRWLRNGAYMDWMPKPAKRRRYTWGECDEHWLREHILDHVPEGSFDGPIATSFWAAVKSGNDPTIAAKDVVLELNRRASRIEAMQGSEAGQ